MKKLLGLIAAAAVALSAGSALADGHLVRIGTEGAYPPFNYIDDNGELQGFDVEIANALCDAAGFECEFVVQDWDGIIPGLIAEKYDAIIASWLASLKCSLTVCFSALNPHSPGSDSISITDANPSSASWALPLSSRPLEL